MNHEQRMAMPSSHLIMPDLDLSKLDDRQKIFVLKYITNGFNGNAAAKEAHYPKGSAKVRASEMLNDHYVKEAIALVMNARCKVLGVDANWVLEKAVTLFERCMQTEKVIDQYGATGEFKFDATNAVKALHIIGKHVDVKAFDNTETISVKDEEIITRLNQARKRLIEPQQDNDIVDADYSPIVCDDPVDLSDDEHIINESISHTEELEPVSFLTPQRSERENILKAAAKAIAEMPPAEQPEIDFTVKRNYSDLVSDVKHIATDDQKLAELMQHMKTNTRVN